MDRADGELLAPPRGSVVRSDLCDPWLRVDVGINLGPFETRSSGEHREKI